MITNNINAKTIQLGVDYYSNNYGSFKVIEMMSTNKGILCRIKFNLTGYEYDAWLDKIKKGEVRDPYYPSIFGNCCLGIVQPGQATILNSRHSTREYSLWHGIAARCYNPKSPEYLYYGAKGIIMSDRWRCFEYFYADLPFIPNYVYWKNSTTKREWQLDKDAYVINEGVENAIYSLETCAFIKGYNNKMLRGVNKENQSSNYVGVYYNKECGNYEAYINYNHKKYGVGRYMTEDAAANARDRAAIKFYGKGVTLNNAPYMTYNEIMQSCVSKNDYTDRLIIPLCNIIDKEE